MRIGFSGTGGAIATAKRDNTALVIASGPALLLVDCTGNPPAALDRMGFDWTAVGAVLLTHRHADHLGGLVPLLHQLRIRHRRASRPPLVVRGPADAVDVAARLLEAVDLLDEPEGFEVVLRPLPEDGEVQIGPFAVRSFPVAHGQVPTAGLRVAPLMQPERAVVYSSDTEPCERVWHEAADAALLVHECSSFVEEAVPGHTTLKQLERVLPAGELNHARLVHLPPASQERERTAQTRLQARFGDVVRLAHDGEVIDL
ncbi:MAG: ribonuclease Z [Deltaproteobacteria bacterium]|nr:ribonuclease Z [Deltaproteobacteria bacterium]